MIEAVGQPQPLIEVALRHRALGGDRKAHGPEIVVERHIRGARRTGARTGRRERPRFGCLRELAVLAEQETAIGRVRRAQAPAQDRVEVARLRRRRRALGGGQHRQAETGTAQQQDRWQDRAHVASPRRFRTRDNSKKARLRAAANGRARRKSGQSSLAPKTADRQANNDLPVGNITDVRDSCIRGQGWLGGPRLPGLVATSRTPGL